jgi:oligoribonuclease NrnB/cAMP/cGMP phosphodiesterase (DHH superfamily)
MITPSENRVMLLSHYDLDGAGCHVCAHQIWDVVKAKHQGYNKVRKSLEDLINLNGCLSKPVDTLVIADLKMQEEDLVHAMEFFDNVIYYDHHEESVEFEKFVSDNFEYHFDLELCSTALMWRDAVSNRNQVAIATERQNRFAMSAFVNVVNAYDLWKEEHSRWEEGKIMNELFWEYGLWDFARRFETGFFGFTPEEYNLYEEIENAKVEQIRNAHVDVLPSGSKIVFLKDQNAVNSVSTELEGDVFYIMNSVSNGVSIRVATEHAETFNVSEGVGRISPENYNGLISGGGHKSAGGLTFADHITHNDVADFIWMYDETIRGAQ